VPRIARQQWRARIETRQISCSAPRLARIARQQWRARIETVRVLVLSSTMPGDRPPAMAGAD